MTKKQQKLMNGIALGAAAFVAYKLISGGRAPWSNAPNDAATMNTTPLQTLPGLPSMQGYEAMGGCGCKRRH